MAGSRSSSRAAEVFLAVHPDGCYDHALLLAVQAGSNFSDALPVEQAVEVGGGSADGVCTKAMVA